MISLVYFIDKERLITYLCIVLLKLSVSCPLYFYFSFLIPVTAVLSFFFNIQKQINAENIAFLINWDIVLDMLHLTQTFPKPVLTASVDTNKDPAKYYRHLCMFCS